MNGLSVGNLAAEIFSPAKMVYIAYILAVSLGKLHTNLRQFIIFSVLFYVAQIFHDDYLRDRLNASGKDNAIGWLKRIWTK